MAEFDLLVVGEINPDLILRGNDLSPVFGQAEKIVDAATLTIGSSSVIMACGAARLGLKTAFVGVIGDDLFGRFMLQEMAHRGIDTSACKRDTALQTGFSIILSEPRDRAILTFAGSIAALAFEDIDQKMLGRARHLHLGSYFLLEKLLPDIPRLFKSAKDLGLSTSLDTNWDPAGRWDNGLQETLTFVDVFMPNEQEALLISGQDTLESALEKLSSQIPIMAVKLGARGGLALSGAEQKRAPVVPVEVVDTTGAGDSFDAGFLWGYLNQWPLERSLQLACACGSLSTRAAGGTTAQPTLEEALAVISR